ncbi:acyl-CoA synthetase [Flavobacterium sp. MDT1-60]|uniref:acyl-CoA synthetase n=1 Tax=Flavobacterium sp. MDT1-60 TaxID=1979344 RepID=UPI00177EF341|nr:acyl-CoA synthetase [Flavobacterium sp. MDT1-60]QOG01209.1 acyl-CoA synthetase [Flavobacterium sp. MDT1-60]
MNQLSTLSEIKEYEDSGMMTLPPNTYEALRIAAKNNSDRVALHFFLDGSAYQNAITFSYKELLGKVNAFANMIYHLGLDNEAGVSVLLPNCPAYVITLFGAQARGVVNPLNPMLELNHLADIINAAQSKIIVTLASNTTMPYLEKARALVKLTPSVEYILTVDLGYYLGEKTSSEIEVINGVHFLDFHHHLDQHNMDSLDFKCTKKYDSIASYFHTGGTTGSPKLAQHSHQNELVNAFMVDKCLQNQSPKTFLCGLPWFHVNGVVVTGLVPLLNGHTLLLATPIGYRNEGLMENFWKIAAHYKVSFFSAVPTILSKLLNVPIGGADISSLENLLCGAAPLSEKLLTDFQKATGLQIIEGYGFTEGTCVSTFNPLKGNKKNGSVGLALPFHQMKAVIIDDNGDYLRDAEINEQGILVAHGPNVISGYKSEIHNKNAFVAIADKRWYNTGDLGRQDADGYFYIVGRKKELIIRGGHNIDPKVIEEPLSKHPFVAAAAAIARPDAYAGELPVVYIELKPNTSATVEELMLFAETHILEKVAVPKKMYIIPQMPLTAVGKIYKPELENCQIKEVFETALLKIPGIDSFAISFDMTNGRIVKIFVICSDNVDYQNLINKELGYYPVKYLIIKS